MLSNSIPRDICEHGCLGMTILEEYLRQNNPEILLSNQFKDFIQIKVKCWRKSELIEVLNSIDFPEEIEEEDT